MNRQQILYSSQTFGVAGMMFFMNGINLESLGIIIMGLPFLVVQMVMHRHYKIHERKYVEIF